MYQSFQSLYTKLQEMSGDATGSATTGQRRRFEQDINGTQSIITGTRGGKWKFLEATATETTVASQRNYDLPANLKKLLSVTVTVSTTIYQPIVIESNELWDAILAMNLGDSDVAQFVHVRGNELLFMPEPAAASNTITYTYRRRPIELRTDDYTTGNVAAATLVGLTITGTSTVWTAAMVGRFIRIRGTNGDNQWYEIASRASDTSIDLQREYQGATFTGATDAYVIGEMSALPPEYHDLLWYRPLAIYYMMHEKFELANYWWRLYDGGYESGLSNEVGGLLGQMFENEQESIEGVMVPATDIWDRIRNFNVNTPPSTTITFSDL